MRIWTTAIGLIAVVAAGYGTAKFVFPEYFHDIAPADAAQQEQPPARQRARRRFPVPVSVISKTTVPVYLEYVGATEAIREVTLQAKVGGYLQETGITDGADVKTGDLLYRIDPDDYQAALDQAKAAAAEQPGGARIRDLQPEAQRGADRHRRRRQGHQRGEDQPDASGPGGDHGRQGRDPHRRSSTSATPRSAPRSTAGSAAAWCMKARW